MGRPSDGSGPASAQPRVSGGAPGVRASTIGHRVRRGQRLAAGGPERRVCLGDAATSDPPGQSPSERQSAGPAYQAPAQRRRVRAEHEIARPALPRGHRAARGRQQLDLDREQAAEPLGAVPDHLGQNAVRDPECETTDRSTRSNRLFDWTIRGLLIPSCVCFGSARRPRTWRQRRGRDPTPAPVHRTACRLLAPFHARSEPLMPNLYCPRCGLRIKVKAAFLLMDNCPRCLGRRRLVTPLVLSPPASWDRPHDERCDPQAATRPTPGERPAPAPVVR